MDVSALTLLICKKSVRFFIYESCEWLDNLVNYLLLYPVKTSPSKVSKTASKKNIFINGNNVKYHFAEKSFPEHFKNQLPMVFTKTVIWLQIFWSLTPTVGELDSREEGITEIKSYLLNEGFKAFFLLQFCGTKDFQSVVARPGIIPSKL